MRRIRRSVIFWRTLAIALGVALAIGWFQANSPGVWPTAQAEAERSKHRPPPQGRTDRLLGEGDVRFGIAIEKGEAAVVSDWQTQDAVFINHEGRRQRLGFKLKHQHAAVSVPADGVTVVESLRGRYYLVNADGRIQDASFADNN